MRILFLIVSFAAFAVVLQAQNLYTPRNVQHAFAQGTRSADGRPGPNYWQNHGTYDIVVNAMPPDAVVRGSEEIVYTNHSPSALPGLVFRLVLNQHRPGASRLSDFGADYFNEGIVIDSFSIAGKPMTWKDPEGHATWQAVRLERPLATQDSVRIRFAWHYTLSKSPGREGIIDPTTFYLAYFYPRVSVYDDYEGWDHMTFTGRQEFYNDFNDYRVTVRCPANFVVWGTGDLQAPESVLQPAPAERLKRSMTSDTVIHVATAADMAAKKITAQKPVNEWVFTAAHITDMAFGLSDHYAWDAGSTPVEKGRRAGVQAAYNDTATDFHHMVTFGKKALSYFSTQWPGVAYPFPKTTVFQGYADMEYPMMVNDGAEQDLAFAELVADHEIAHTWFPFYMGINETRYGFMDEAWATTMEYWIGIQHVGKAAADSFYRSFRTKRWISDPSGDEDVPIIVPANVLNGVALGNNEYGKASLGYIALRDLLGDELFRKCLHAYMDRWHGKHPIPWDFFNTFNNVSGKDLTWFWKNWFFSFHYSDLDPGELVQDARGATFLVKNKGGFAVPFDLVVRYEDGSTGTQHVTPAVWEKDDTKTVISLPATKKIRSVTIDPGIYMDATPDEK